jgi:hypothetical protein
MKTMFKTTDYELEIERVKIESETEKTITFNGRRRAKNTRYHNLFNTIEEAIQFKKNQYRQNVYNQQRWLEESKIELFKAIRYYRKLTKHKGHKHEKLR